jgi:hypothetical protein
MTKCSNCSGHVFVADDDPAVHPVPVLAHLEDTGCDDPSSDGVFTEDDQGNWHEVTISPLAFVESLRGTNTDVDWSDR